MSASLLENIRFYNGQSNFSAENLVDQRFWRREKRVTIKLWQKREAERFTQALRELKHLIRPNLARLRNRINRKEWSDPSSTVKFQHNLQKKSAVWPHWKWITFLVFPWNAWGVLPLQEICWKAKLSLIYYCHTKKKERNEKKHPLLFSHPVEPFLQWTDAIVKPLVVQCQKTQAVLDREDSGVQVEKENSKEQD